MYQMMLFKLLIQFPNLLKKFEYDLKIRSTSSDLPYLASNDLAAASRSNKYSLSSMLFT